MTNEAIIPNMRGTWRTIPSRDGKRTFLVRTDVPNPADHLHVTDPGAREGARGYCGAELRFALEGGGVFVAVGPWHTNGRFMRDQTRLDLTHLHLTRVTIQADEDDLALYDEDAPALGRFDRGVEIARSLANAQQRAMRVRIQSAGGGSVRTVKPDDATSDAESDTADA